MMSVTRIQLQLALSSGERSVDLGRSVGQPWSVGELGRAGWQTTSLGTKLEIVMLVNQFM